MKRWFKRSALPPPALSRSEPPWLFAVALATTLPHAFTQPFWLTAWAGLCWVWALILWRNDRRLPARWLLLPLALAGALAIRIEFGSFFGREPGVAVLVLFMALKLLEMRQRRDAVVVIMLGYFLLLTHYFEAQDIPTALWMLFALWLVSAALLRLHAGALAVRPVLTQSARLLAQALPLMLIFYLFFPRIPGPLWGLPQDAFSARTGLSESMAPGSIGQLVQNDAIAFRVRFDGPVPPKNRLYWRGPVLTAFDGQRWQSGPVTGGKPVIDAAGEDIAYEMTLEAHGQRWLLALDAPRQLPADARADARLTVLMARPVENRQRFRLSATLDYRFNEEETAAIRALNLALPAGFNPRTVALAETWRNTRTPEQIVAAALTHFRTEAFYYTLQPPLLGRDSVDEFLFVSRRGFCEHYAAAFVVLMRAAGIPARVVTGYQGGEINPHDGFLVVRQSDAHAWAEVWLAGRGWVRVDPTAAVAPERIERGLASALPAGEPLPFFMRASNDWLRPLLQRWEALNNAWQQQVLGYDQRRQQALLQRLGLPGGWQTLAWLLAGLSTLGLVLLTTLLLYQKRRTPPEIRLWQHALRRTGVHCAPAESPLALAARLARENPETAQRLAPVIESFVLVRYAPDGREHLATLRAAVAALGRRRTP